MRPIQLLLFVCALAISLGLFAREEEDKTISPSFFVSSPDSTTDRLPLKYSAAEVRINGAIVLDISVKVFTRQQLSKRVFKIRSSLTGT